MNLCGLFACPADNQIVMLISIHVRDRKRRAATIKPHRQQGLLVRMKTFLGNERQSALLAFIDELRRWRFQWSLKFRSTRWFSDRVTTIHREVREHLGVTARPFDCNARHVAVVAHPEMQHGLTARQITATQNQLSHLYSTGGL